jgi:hypothetical protein
MRPLIFWLFINCTLVAGDGRVIPTEAHAGWGEMEKLVAVFQLQCEIKQKKNNSVRKISLVGQDTRLKLEGEVKNKEGKLDKDACIRNEFGFLLNRRKDRWQLGRVFQPEEPFPNVDGAVFNVRCGFSAWHCCLLRELGSKPEFKVAGWQVSPKDPALIELTFDCLESKEKRRFDNAKFTLDPRKRYRVVEFFLYDSAPTPAQYQYQYSDRSILEEVVPMVQNGPSAKVTVASVSADRVPDEHFKLSHYGLPDYVPPTKSSRAIWIYGLGVAVATTILAILFVRKRS